MSDVYADFTLTANSSEPVELPAEAVFSAMDMSRSGSDLVLETEGGETIVVEGYFDQQPPPDLVGAEQQQIPGNIVMSLAGESDYSLTPEGLTAEPIGQIHSLSGNVYVVRTDGTRIEAGIDMQLFKGDVLETLGDGAIGVVLADETSFSMTNDAVMVLDELVYDPGEQEGELSLFMLRGLATLTSGMISKTDPDGMTLDTPVGTIGIRGTQIGIDATGDDVLSIVMMEEADGYVGEITLINPAGVIVLNQAYHVIGVSAGNPPATLPPVDADHVTTVYGHGLSHLPLTGGSANDYSTQQPGGGDETGLDETPEVEDTPVPGDGEPEDLPAEVEATEPVTQVVAEEPPLPLQPVVEPDGVPEPEPVQEEPVAQTAATTPDATRPDTQETVVPVTDGAEETPDYGVNINYPPIAFAEAISLKEDETASGQLLATDADQDALSFTVADNGQPANGTVTVNPDGTYLYTPEPDFSGTDEFTFAVSDGQGGVTESTVSIQVLPVAAEPVITVQHISLGDVIPGIDIDGTKKDDVIIGTAGGDTIDGGKGDDIIIGDSGEYTGELTVPLDIQVTLDENEPAGALSITLQGIPDGATLSAGTDEGGGQWSINPNELDGLSLTLPEGHQDDFQLVVQATNTETDAETGATDTAAQTSTLHITMSGDGGNDIIDAGKGDDTVLGGTGDDTILGDKGDDVLYGGAGDDTLSGGQGDDVLSGGHGDDVLSGGKGDDSLYGGEGFDAFIFSLDSDADSIADYKAGELIRFEGAEFSDASPEIVGNDDGSVSILFNDHDVSVTVDNVDLNQHSYSITRSDDGVVVVFDDSEV